MKLNDAVQNAQGRSVWRTRKYLRITAEDYEADDWVILDGFSTAKDGKGKTPEWEILDILRRIERHLRNHRISLAVYAVSGASIAFSIAAIVIWIIVAATR